MIKLIKPVILGLAAVGILAYADPAMPNMTSLQAQLDQLQLKINSMENSADTHTMIVHTNAALTQSLLSVQRGSTGNLLTLLNAQKAGTLADGVTLGGFAEASAIYEKVSDTTAFQQASFATHVSNIQSISGQTSGSATQLVIPRVELSVIANMNAWSTGYFSMDARNFENTNGFHSNSTNLSVDSAVMILGNLSQMPVYAFLGRNTIDFGSFQTVNFNTPSLNRLAFQAYGDELGLGFSTNGLAGTFSIINDNDGLQTTRSDGVAFNTHTQHADGVGNYALNLGYSGNFSGTNFHVGGGYLNGSKQQNSSGEQSGAYDFNGKISFACVDVLGEFTQTTNAVYDAYYNATGSKLRVWDLGGDYNFNLFGKASKVNLDYSRASAQYVASQWVLGFDQNTFNNLWLGVEYTQSRGVFIGDNVPLDNSLTYGSVYGHAKAFVPTSVTNAKDSTILFDVQGVF